jgi:hypothetical protein
MMKCIEILILVSYYAEMLSKWSLYNFQALVSSLKGKADVTSVPNWKDEFLRVPVDGVDGFMG